MPYAANTIYLVKKGPRNLGNTLGRIAVELDFSVNKIAKATGATRQTVYNWMSGGEVMTPYRPVVTKLVELLNTASNAENAWRKVCQEFNLPS